MFIINIRTIWQKRWSLNSSPASCYRYQVIFLDIFLIGENIWVENIMDFQKHNGLPTIKYVWALINIHCIKQMHFLRNLEFENSLDKFLRILLIICLPKFQTGILRLIFPENSWKRAGQKLPLSRETYRSNEIIVY